MQTWLDWLLSAWWAMPLVILGGGLVAYCGMHAGACALDWVVRRCLYRD